MNILGTSKDIYNENIYWEVDTTWWDGNAHGTATEGTKELMQLFDGKIVFDFPKPTRLIKSLLRIVSRQDGDIVLDSFAGTATTAHAVLDLNKEDGGNRKFILVECEDYADEITAERVRRVIKGVPGAKDEKLKKGLGGSFSYFSLVSLLNGSILEGKIASYIDWHVTFLHSPGEEFYRRRYEDKNHW